MTDVLRQLQKASWRDITFPVTGTRDYGFAQEQAQHRYIFRDQQLIESLGRQNPTFRYNIPFRENVQRGFSALFIGIYPLFLAACQDRTAGILVDPVHGAVRCKCASFAESLDVNKRDGVDVLVDFIFAPESVDDVSSNFAQLSKSLTGAVQSAVRFGANVGELSEEQAAIVESLNQPAERGRVSIFNAARAATGSVIQTRNKVSANLNDASTQMDNARTEIEEARDPKLEPLRRDASRLALSSRELAKTAGRPTTPYEVVRTVGEIGRIAFCTANRMTVDAFLELNQQFADLRTIPAGTPVRVPRRDQ